MISINANFDVELSPTKVGEALANAYDDQQIEFFKSFASSANDCMIEHEMIYQFSGIHESLTEIELKTLKIIFDSILTGS